MAALLGFAGMAVILMLPAALFWLVLGLWFRPRPLWRMGLAALLGGVAVSGADMWADWSDGFCCRDYEPVTVWTELPFFAGVACVLTGATFLGFWLIRALVLWVRSLVGPRP